MLNNRILLSLIASFLMLSHCASASCLDRNSKIDVNCSCQKKNSCFKLKNKKYKKSLKNLATVITAKRAKKIHSMRNDVAKEMQNVFAGKFVYDPKKIKNFQKRTAKISKYNKKLTKKVEKLISKKYGKKFSLEKRKKKLKSKLSKAIPQKLKDKVRDKGMSYSLINGLVSGKTVNLANVNYQEIPEQNLGSITKSIIQKTNAVTTGKKGTTRNNDYKLSISEKDKTKKIMGKSYKSKQIHGSNKDLFRLISKRYRLSYRLLDNSVITAATFGTSRSKARKEQLKILSKLGL